MINSLQTSSALEVSRILHDTAYISLMSLQKNLTMDVAATAKTVTQVTKTLGEETTTKLVCAILKLFNDGLNTSVQMGSKQLFEYAMLWCEAFPNDTVKDLILCLKRTKTGQYGDLYNRIDGQVISKFFRKYLEEKAEWGEQQNRQFISNQVQAGNNLFKALPDEQKKQINDLLKKPNVYVIPKDSPLSSDKSYTEYLKVHAEEIEFEVLENVAQRARSQDMQEVLTIATAEIDRRSQLDRQADT